MHSKGQPKENKKENIEIGKKLIENFPHKKWFNLNCKQIGTNLERLGQKLSETPKGTYLREQFLKLKRKYRSTCRKKKKKILTKYITKI